MKRHRVHFVTSFALIAVAAAVAACGEGNGILIEDGAGGTGSGGIVGRGGGDGSAGSGGAIGGGGAPGGGPGGSGGAIGGGGASGGGAPGGGGAIGSGGASGDVCAPNGICSQLEVEYAAAVQAARRCFPGAQGQCGQKVQQSLACGCDVIVNDAEAPQALAAKWTAAGCLKCVIACPAIACIDPGPTGVCEGLAQPLPAAGGAAPAIIAQPEGLCVARSRVSPGPVID